MVSVGPLSTIFPRYMIDVLAQNERNSQVVRNKQQTQIEFPLQQPQKVKDLCPDADVQRGHRLVGHKEAGFSRQGLPRSRRAAVDRPKVDADNAEDTRTQA